MAAGASVAIQTGLVQQGDDVVETRLRWSGNPLLVPAYMNHPE